MTLCTVLSVLQLCVRALVLLSARCVGVRKTSESLAALAFSCFCRVFTTIELKVRHNADNANS